MPITVKEITLADKDRFNAFLARHPKGHILQTWEWGEVKASTGWQPIRLLAERNGEPVAASVEGVILNPWNRTLMLNKTLINSILGNPV